MLYETIYNAQDTDLPFQFVFPSVSLTSIVTSQGEGGIEGTPVRPSPLTQNVSQLDTEEIMEEGLAKHQESAQKESEKDQQDSVLVKGRKRK